MMLRQGFVKRGQMEPENFSQLLFCRLCLSGTSYTNSEVIDEVAREALKVILPNLNLEERHTHRMCTTCYSQLFAAFNFKSSCMGTEDLLLSHVEANKVSMIDLKDIFLTLNSNIQLMDVLENQRICRLCIQLVTDDFMSFNEVDNDIINTYIPQVRISTTQDPIICRPCFDSLYTHGGFINNCLEIQEKYKKADKQFWIKTEENGIKLEDGHDTQKTYENVDEQFDVKFEHFEIKSEEATKNNDSSTGNLNEKTTEIKTEHLFEEEEEMKYAYMDECETEDQINKGEGPLHLLSNIGYKRKFKDDVNHKIAPKLKKSYPRNQVYKCDVCDFESKLKRDLKNHHQLTHPPVVRMYRCDACSYATRHRNSLKNHKLTHRDPSEMRMYKCDVCTYEAKCSSRLKEHQLSHKDSSEVQMYKCDTCTYESKRRSHLRVHQLIHKDYKEVQMHKCDICSFETIYKSSLKNHKLKHDNPSTARKCECTASNYNTDDPCHQSECKRCLDREVFKCNECNFETARKRALLAHFLKHQDPSRLPMYRCDKCVFQTKHKNSLIQHMKVHRNS